MEAGSDLMLRLVGAFYVFAGYVATRAALVSNQLDVAIAGIGGKTLTRKERLLTVWLLASAGLVLVGGATLLARLDVAPWLFLASALGQLVFIAVLGPRYFDTDDPPDPKGRQQTTNAFYFYIVATSFVIWAWSAGRLRDFAEVSILELAAGGALVIAHFANLAWRLTR